MKSKSRQARSFTRRARESIFGLHDVVIPYRQKKQQSSYLPGADHLDIIAMHTVSAHTIQEQLRTPFASPRATMLIGMYFLPRSPLSPAH